jgi:hypothetical protein
MCFLSILPGSARESAETSIQNRDIITSFFGTRIKLTQCREEITSSINELQNHVNDYLAGSTAMTDLEFVKTYKTLIVENIYYKAYECTNNMGKRMLVDVHNVPHHLTQRLEKDLSIILDKNFKEIVGTTPDLLKKITTLANALAKLGDRSFQTKIIAQKQCQKDLEFCDEGLFQRIVWEDNLFLDLLIAALEKREELISMPKVPPQKIKR